jgi:hypothetical protein
MSAISRTFTSVRLTFKVNRFEVVAATIGLLLLAAGAVFIKAKLDGVGVTRECLQAWLASVSEPPAACVEPVTRWSNLTNDFGGKLSGAMLFLPLVAGLILGVPLIGREIEQRTAATAWALSGSRTRWLAGRLVPILLLAVGLGLVLAVASTVLEVARTAGGIWGPSFDAAMFFGPPIVAHVVLGLAIGLLSGALVGRTLPALIVGAVATLVALILVFTVKAGWDPQRSLYDSSVSTSSVFTNDLPNADLLDPIWDYRFASLDGSQYLTRDEALATVPAGTADVRKWLKDHYQPEFRGPSEVVTRNWQALETIGLLIAAGVLLLIAFPIVERRRPG